VTASGAIATACIVLALGAGLLAGCAVSTRPRPQSPIAAAAAAAPAPATERRFTAADIPIPLRDPHLRVRKAARALDVLSGDALLATFHVGLGGSPVGDKEREGDGKTPEGRFYVCCKNRESRYFRSLGLSYPDAEDAERGLRAGLIDRAQHEEIEEMIASGKRPPWDTALGGEIMIHGHGGDRGDWTKGCIALDDDVMDRLFRAIPEGAPVEVVP
jgi:hypothetical protein